LPWGGHVAITLFLRHQEASLALCPPYSIKESDRKSDFGVDTATSAFFDKFYESVPNVREELKKVLTCKNVNIYSKVEELVNCDCLIVFTSEPVKTPSVPAMTPEWSQCENKDRR